MTRFGITMPSRTASMDRFAEYARWADEAGFDSVWDYELYRNPFTLLAGAAPATSRIALATGLAAAFSRSPFEMANAAADIDELSHGRMLLGLGAGVGEFLTAFHNTDSTRVVARMREYIDVLRLSWQYLHHGEAPAYSGLHYRFIPPPINPWGVRDLPRDRIPVYLAAMKPALMQLCGETADGWLGYLATPQFADEQLRPNIAIGAQRAGRDPAEIELACEVITSVHADRAEAYRRARIHVGFYVIHPMSDPVVHAHGLAEEQNAIRMALMSGGFAALEGTPDALVEAFSITGTPDEAREKLAPWESAFDHVIFHTPYVPPLTAAESEDSYRAIVTALGETTRPRRSLSAV